jgi:predicted phosphodiesterase
VRIALLSDVHGNTIALDAVLTDLRLWEPVDEVWLLGDLAAIGYDPVGVLERLSQLPNARFVRGNTEEYITAGTLPPPTPEDVQASPELLPGFTEMVRAFGWTQGALTTAGWLGWLVDLPLEQRTTLPDGTRLLGVHVSPGTTVGPGIRPSLSEEETGSLLAGCEADLVCVGHTHYPLHIQVGGVDLVNVGGVSNPVVPDLLARYVLLDGDRAGYHVQWRSVSYDREAVIAAAYDVRYPGAAYIEKYMRGQCQPSWANVSAAAAASQGTV